MFKFTTGAGAGSIIDTTPELLTAINETAAETPVLSATEATYTHPTKGHTIVLSPVGLSFRGPPATVVYYTAALTVPLTTTDWASSNGQPTRASLSIKFVADGCNEVATSFAKAVYSPGAYKPDSFQQFGEGGGGNEGRPGQSKTLRPGLNFPVSDDEIRDDKLAAKHIIKPQFIDLYINVRVSNGHPKSLDTILRVRFTVAYVLHEPSALHTWNTRASTAAAGVIQSGVVGDAPEGGKEQHEDTTVVVA